MATDRRYVRTYYCILSRASCPYVASGTYRNIVYVDLVGDGVAHCGSTSTTFLLLLLSDHRLPLFSFRIRRFLLQ